MVSAIHPICLLIRDSVHEIVSYSDGLVDVPTNLQLVRMHGEVGTRKIALY